MSATEQMIHELARRQPAHSLAQPFYVDRAFHELDEQLIFEQEWLFAAHTCELRRPGDFVTLQVGRNPIVLVRGDDGEIRAFFNTCRHRGSKVCTAERGRSPKLVCPYHQWTYNLDGTLIYAGHMQQGFDARGYRLRPVHVRVMGGYVFICLADEPPADIDEFLRVAEPYVQPHGLERAKVAAEESIIEQGNWKLVMENNRECYHCAGGHPELLRTLSEYDKPDDPRMDPKFRELQQACYARWSEAGLPSDGVMADRWRVARIPFIRGAVSMTLDGRPASRRRMGNLQVDDAGSMRMLWLPNSWNHLQADHCLSFRVLPISATETLVTTKWLVHENAVEGVDYDLDNLKRVWSRTNAQDRYFVELTQAGVASRAYQPGPYSTQIEQGVIHFVDWYCAAMERHLGMSAGQRQAAG